MTQRNSWYSHCLRRFASSESSPTLLGSDSLRDQWTGDDQRVFHRKRPSELLAVLASHVLTWTLACETVRVFKHKSVWWLSIVIDSFIHADGDFFFLFLLPGVLWRLMRTLKTEHCSYQHYSEAFRHDICQEACCRVWPHHQEHIQIK